LEKRRFLTQGLHTAEVSDKEAQPAFFSHPEARQSNDDAGKMRRSHQLYSHASKTFNFARETLKID
jgi:hypothetical protein